VSFRLRVIAFVLFGAVHAAGAAGDRGDVAELEAALARYPGGGDIVLPALDTKELEALLNGEPVVRIETGRSGGGDDDEPVGDMGVVGFRVVDAPRLLVWLTVMGVASEPDVRLTRATLSRADAGAYTRYQHVNLPWPIRDRHWVVYCEKNLDVALASRDSFWEHRWRLVEDGLTLIDAAHQQGAITGLSADELDKSIYLPANRGAWALTELDPGRTLVIAFFDGELGGFFPDALVRQFTKLHLREGLNLVSELSFTTWQEYSDDEPVHDGYGRAVRQHDVRQAALLLDASNPPGGDSG